MRCFLTQIADGSCIKDSTTSLQRLGDLQRMIRQYGRTEDQVFPEGTFFKGGPYENDVNFPVTIDELNNPNFTACANRNA